MEWDSNIEYLLLFRALFGAPQDKDSNGIVSGSVYGCNLNTNECEQILHGKSRSMNILGRRVEMKADNMSYGELSQIASLDQYSEFIGERRSLDQSPVWSTYRRISALNLSGMTMAYDEKNEQFSVCAPRSNLAYFVGPGQQEGLNYFTIGSCYVYRKDFTPFTELNVEGDLEQVEDLNDRDKSGVLHYINSMRELGFSQSMKNG